MNAPTRSVVLRSVAWVALAYLLFSSVLNAEPPKAKSDSKGLSQELKQIGRLVVSNELMRLHWTTWVSGTELRKISAEAARDINGQLEIRPDVQFLLPDVKAKPQRFSAFEKQAVADIRAGVAEVWHKEADTIQYVRGIRATRTCIQCHHPLGAPGMELEEGDLLAVIRVTLDD